MRVTNQEAKALLDEIIPDIMVEVDTKTKLPKIVDESSSQYALGKTLIYCRHMLESVEDDDEAAFGLDVAAVGIDINEMKKQIKGDKDGSK